MANATILVVEDESDIQELVEFNLRQAGYQVLKADDGLEGLRLARTHRPDLVLLDLLLGGLEGREVCRRLKQSEDTRQIPVMMLTALASETDRIVGFEIGADDYLTKPFSPRELVLRVQAVLRRTREEPTHEAPLRSDELTIDPGRHEALAHGRALDLTATEFKLLHYLASHAGLVLTRQQLLERVWGYAYEGYARTVDTHVRRLRQKLGRLSRRIETVRGIGYRFREPS